MKVTPPWSRRRATQPASVTVVPASLARRPPASWVRITAHLLASRTHAAAVRHSLRALDTASGDHRGRAHDTPPIIVGGSPLLGRLMGLCAYRRSRRACPRRVGGGALASGRMDVRERATGARIDAH